MTMKLNTLRKAIANTWRERKADRMKSIGADIGNASARFLSTAESNRAKGKDGVALVAYVTKRMLVSIEKGKAADMAKLDAAIASGGFESADIEVEWTRNRTWGANPRAYARVDGREYSTGSIGGCGYDKLSTAVAEALNQCPAAMLPLYRKANQAPGKNRKTIGYGTGYGILPSLEGGVGINSLLEAYRNLGYTVTQHSGRGNYGTDFITIRK